MTCAHFGRNQICTQVDASFSSFSHPTQVNASGVTSINLLLANDWNRGQSALKCFFWGDLRVLARKLVSSFGHPTNKSLRKFNLHQLATACRSVWPGLYGYSEPLLVLQKKNRTRAIFKETPINYILMERFCFTDWFLKAGETVMPKRSTEIPANYSGINCDRRCKITV